ncbi:serine/threonine-protein kinase [Hyalangium minutum]|uniref:serine/threonine-protein kinase n=1 Tax=Hyalangium minutum TaxID=394096 RepID=UPI0005C6EAC0|nr:serine/threonine-protein kinase [Hyalangium minutum]
MRVGPVENQGSNAHISRSRVGNITHVKISGVIDETFPLTSASPDLTGIVILDLGAVDRISSFGVRKWIEFVSRLPQGAISMYVVYAPPVVVDQLNMVEGFAGVSRVLTVLAPYTCKTCSEDRLRAVNLMDEAQIISENRAPEHNCPVCSNPLEFADLPSEFFGYMRRQNLSSVDPVVMRYLRLTVAAEPLDLPQTLKVVQDDMTYVTLASVIRGDLNVRRLASGLEGRVAFDFSHVAKVELEGVLKLEQVLETSAKGAHVVLCRVPPSVLSPLAKSGKPLPAKIHSLWLPYECQNCGQLHHQRQHAASFLQLLKQNEGQERPCVVCGGASRLASIPNLPQFLARVPLTDRPHEDIEALESKAITQFLFGQANAEPQQGNAGNTDISGNHSGSKLQIIRRLGQGGMAEVFLAKQVGVKGFEKFLVMKKILQQFAENPEFVDMLFAEARANARLTHPNVVQTFDVGVTDGVAYILMEYVRGPDLKRLMNELRRKGLALPMEHALRIVAETSAGLHYAHSYVDPAGNAHPVVHRDVSPHNILISLDGAVKLSDFGIAKVQGEDHTQAGVLKGKISYISPEAAAGRPLDARNDVFALGVVLFELLTGQLPFRRDHDAATLNAIVREPAPVPSQLKPSIPQDVSDLILRALVKDPSRRTPSAAAMREEIEAVMAHHRLNSSPAAVAQFFKDTLADRLSEYAPAGASTSSGSGSHPRLNAGGTGDLESPSNTRSSARLAGAASGSGTGSGSRPNLTGSRPGTGSGPVATPNPKSGSGPRPIPTAATQPPAEAASAEAAEQARMRQAAGQQARPSTSSRPALGAVPQAPSSGSTRSGIRQMPTAQGAPAQVMAQGNTAPVAAVAPSQTGQRPSVVGTPAVAVATAPVSRPSTQVAAHAPAPRPSVPAPNQAPSRTAMPAVPSPAPIPNPIPVAATTTPASVQPEVAEPSSSKTWILVAVGAVLLAIVGFIAMRVMSSGDGIQVINLAPGEKLYIGGLQVDSKAPRVEKPGALLVSTAMDGKLRRFGRTERRDRIDVRTIPEALPQPGSTGTLSLVGNIKGCTIKIGENVLPESSAKTSIEAGKELPVIITCPGGDGLAVSVMAVPGQEVELDPWPKK